MRKELLVICRLLNAFSPSSGVSENPVDDLEFGEIEFGDLDFGDLELGDLEMGDLEVGDPELGDFELSDLEFGDLEFSDLEFDDRNGWLDNFKSDDLDLKLDNRRTFSACNPAASFLQSTLRNQKHRNL